MMHQKMEMWKCEKQYASPDARGAAANVEVRTREDHVRRLQSGKQAHGGNAQHHTDEIRIRTLQQYGTGRRRILKTRTRYKRARTREANKEEQLQETTDG